MSSRPLALAALLLLPFALACSGSGDRQPPNSEDAPPPVGSTLNSRQDSDESVADIVEQAGDSVVRVGVNCQGGQSATCAGTGSGWLYDDDGHFVTNNHVVTMGGQVSEPQNIILTTRDGLDIEGTLVGRDPNSDLAVVRAEQGDMARFELANLEDHRIGDPVVAIGYALDLGSSPSVTTGVISAMERQIQDPRVAIYGLVQTDAAINPGNSGGPLLDHAGRVVGVNTATIQGAQGIGFAVGSDVVGAVVAEILEQGSVDRGYLGIGFLEVRPGLSENLGLPVERGLLIGQVQPGSPADEAGLQQDDLLTRFDGAEIEFTSDLTIALVERAPGDEVEVEYYRDGESETTTITLGQPPDAP